MTATLKAAGIAALVVAALFLFCAPLFVSAQSYGYADPYFYGYEEAYCDDYWYPCDEYYFDDSSYYYEDDWMFYQSTYMPTYQPYQQSYQSPYTPSYSYNSYTYPQQYPSYNYYGYGQQASAYTPASYGYPTGDTDTFGSPLCIWPGYDGRASCDSNPRQPVYDPWTGRWY